MSTRSIPINPGGRLALADVVGRDQEIRRLWEVLRRQGVVLSAERRIGKTHILWKLQENCPTGITTFYQDLEGIYSVRELIHAVLELTATGVKGSIKKAAIGIAKFLPTRIGGTDLPKLEDHWKALFRDSIEKALVRHTDSELVIFLWDEFPMMLRNLTNSHEPTVALELLDTLRELRQRHPEKLRFLLTGSIGLPIVLRSLPDGTLASLNDMHSLTVEPLSRQAINQLASGLITSMRHPPRNVKQIATSIADNIEGFPYYIHHMVDQLNLLGRPPRPSDVSNVFDHLLKADSDPANLSYYRDRLKLYYTDKQRGLATKLLDLLSSSDEPIGLNQLGNLIRHADVAITNQQIKETLILLKDDHYLLMTDNHDFAFRWTIVKKWWRANPL